MCSLSLVPRHPESCFITCLLCWALNRLNTIQDQHDALPHAGKSEHLEAPRFGFTQRCPGERCLSGECVVSGNLFPETACHCRTNSLLRMHSETCNRSNSICQRLPD